MNTSLNRQWEGWPRAASVAVHDRAVHVCLEDGREISVPIEWFGFLDGATDAELHDLTILGGGDGIWWETIDEGVSVPSLLGLPEIPPPDPSIHTYHVDYQPEDGGWIAVIRGTMLSSDGETLAEAKRAIRSNLRRYLGVPSLRSAGIDVVDEVQHDLAQARH